MKDKDLIIRLSIIAVLGAVTTIHYAQKASIYRRIAIKEAIAFETMNGLMFRAKERITDPEKLQEFEAMLESKIEMSAKLIKDV